MRDYAVLSHVPATLTLIDFQGKVGSVEIVKVCVCVGGGKKWLRGSVSLCLCVCVCVCVRACVLACKHTQTIAF
jgi:hypothetical protein